VQGKKGGFFLPRMEGNSAAQIKFKKIEKSFYAMLEGKKSRYE